MKRLATFLAIILMAAAVAAEHCLEQGVETVTRDQVEGAALLYRTADPTRWVPAPALDTRLEVVVRGPLATTRVVQRFANPSDEWVEGVYVYPLPTGTAVSELRLIVGERIVEGQVQERQQAAATYRAARDAGQTASLVEQERPNLFTTSVANIGPRETVVVQIGFQQVLRWDRDRFELRFPTVVGPRYVPAGVADGGRVRPPVLAEGSSRRNRLAMTVDLDMGAPLATVVSPSSLFAVEHVGPTRYRLELDGPGAIADRDVVLQWAPRPGTAPRAAVFSERLEGQVYTLVMVLPPAAELAPAVRLAREVVLVIDTSGSMDGTSIQQARAAVLDALDRLRPGDFFNVIRFASAADALFPRSVAAVPMNLERAREWVRRLRSGGGTEMTRALDLALSDQLETTPLRQVVFVTDGCVANEDRLFAQIRADLGRSRLFTVGIGSAPNHHFMERAAAFGRGTFTYVGAAGEIRQRMDELMGALETPVLTDLELRWPDPAAEMWPPRLPDLYAGEPIVVAARQAVTGGALQIAGRTADGRWSVSVPLAGADARAGIDRLWAERKVAALMDGLAGGVPESEVRAAVVPVALAHHLLTRYTSLVAVDVTPRRAAAEPLVARDVPTHMPAGWTMGRLPQGGTGWRLRLLLAALAAAVAGWLWRRWW